MRNIRKHKLRGQFVRARSKWIEEGEKPSTYFCSLKARNFISKQIQTRNVSETSMPPLVQNSRLSSL